MYSMREAGVFGFTYRPGFLGFLQRQAQAHLARQVPDASLRQRLTPEFAIGCKRILISNKWYPALQRPNVELVSEPIASIRPTR